MEMMYVIPSPSATLRVNSARNLWMWGNARSCVQAPPQIPRRPDKPGLLGMTDYQN